jgi:Tol biopolymer transport system component
MNDPKKRNFDLYAIDTDGNNLERITHFAGFDGFPMFSPDGKFFVFFSIFYQSNSLFTFIFICEWTDE